MIRTINDIRITPWRLALIVAVAVIVVDQIIKFWVKTTFYLGEDRAITSWFHLAFIENNGMAFGWTLGSKLLLTLFRIVFVGAIAWMLYKLRDCRQLTPGFFVVCALILAGAFGNIIDCMFYGLWFNDPSPTAVATFLPEGGGYGSLLHGRVVDMFYFPLFSFTWPSWVPFVGGEHFEFFKPVFNFADSAITVGVFVLLIFYTRQVSVAYEQIRAIIGEKIKRDKK